MRVLFAPLLFLILGSVQGKKDRHESPIDQLPPENQTGANTFGCLVNGQAFIPKGSSLAGPILQVNYQLLYPDSKDGFILEITGRDRSTDEVKSITVGFDSLAAEQGEKYLLKAKSRGNACGQYSYYPTSGAYQIFQTNNVASGELWIKKLDVVNQIVSGTFWFDAVNETGQKVQVREGRFDVRYTR